MKGASLITFFILICFLLFFWHPNHSHATESVQTSGPYTPDWNSLDSRPLPDWYDRGKLGIFIHWGVFSVPSFGSEWFWWRWKGRLLPAEIDFMNRCYPPGFAYADFATRFTASMFNATEWAQLFHKSGARYVVLTSKHHEGFALWPSNYSWNWNAATVGPKRDLVGELAQAVRQEKMRFGVYHSFYEWFNPLWIADRESGFKQQNFVNTKILPEMYELVNAYKPEVFWSDGEWEASDDYWKSKEFLAWLYNESPVKDTVAVNDRWGHETACKHGGFYNCADRFSPGKLMHHKWENAMTLDKTSWGYSRTSKLSDYMTIEELLIELTSTVSCGGNMLINVGPTLDGLIPIVFQDRLTQLGQWMEVNKEAIYDTRPFAMQNDTLTGDAWYTQSLDGQRLYCMFSQWPRDHQLRLNLTDWLKSDSRVELLTSNHPHALKLSLLSNEVQVQLKPELLLDTRWVWTLKFWL